MRDIRTMQQGDVYVHNLDPSLVWLVIELHHEENVNGVVIHYRCLDLISGQVASHAAAVGSIIDDCWELFRP